MEGGREEKAIADVEHKFLTAGIWTEIKVAFKRL